MHTSTSSTFVERQLTPEKRLEIAEAVAVRFQLEGSWQQGECERQTDLLLTDE